MVYHEERKRNETIFNYLIFNQRVNKNKWIKKAKYIGKGKLDKNKIQKEKRIFEKELILDREYFFLNKEQVKKIEDFKSLYNNKINSLKKEEYSKFKKAFFTELTYDSNAIEGSTFNLQETSLVLNDNLAPRGKSLREIYEIKNHSEVLNFLDNYKGEFNEIFILKLHSIILKNISNRFAGNYRKTNIKVAGSDFKFPSYEKVPQLMKNLIYEYNKKKKKLHSFELAAFISSKFVTIHPFTDGNGRVSRLILNFILRKNNYPWINIYFKQREEYLNAIRKANDKNYSEITNFLLNVLEENLKDFGFI